MVGKLVNIASRCAGFITRTRRHPGGACRIPRCSSLRRGRRAIAAAYEARDYGEAMREISFWKRTQTSVCTRLEEVAQVQRSIGVWQRAGHENSACSSCQIMKSGVMQCVRKRRGTARMRLVDGLLVRILAGDGRWSSSVWMAESMGRMPMRAPLCMAFSS